MDYNKQLFDDALSDAYFEWSQLCLQREYLNERIEKLERTMRNICDNAQRMEFIKKYNLSYKEAAKVLNA